MRPRYSVITAYAALLNFANALQTNLFLATHDATQRILQAEEKEQRKLDMEVVDSVKEGNAHLEGYEHQYGKLSTFPNTNGPPLVECTNC